MDSDHQEEAIVVFTEMIRLRPDYAEGWNKRATVPCSASVTPSPIV